MRLRPTLALAALAAILMAAPPAAAVDVTFKVRMARQVALGAFDPAQDSVDVAGSFNGWGTNPVTPLSDADGDTVYAVTVGGFNTGQTIEYKYRINAQWDGTEEFPGVGNNRVYTVQADFNVIDVWYNDVAPGGVVEPGPTSWWNDAVFYEIFVRSFQDSDGDGIGDLPGLTSRLDYLNDGDPDTDTDLGVTGIWLMPINDSPSYHGYDAVDYRSINPDYGTLADFEAFLAAAHARGIKVIVDYVMNHCSAEHPWFVASRNGDLTYRDWFRWSPYDPGDTGPWGQQVWHQYGPNWYYGLFWSGMPDLNYDEPAVKDEMFATATWWLNDVGVDGFRLDAVLYIDEDPGLLQTTPGTLQFWQEFGAHVRSTAPDALTVGEAWTASSTAVQYVGDGRLDLCFEFDQAYAILGAANGGDARGLAAKVDQVYNLYPYLQYGTFLTNHDQDRVLNAVGFDEGRNRAAAGVCLLLPGVPFLYYGEEIGMTGSGAHEFIRSPMQWTGGAGAGFTTGTPWQPINADYASYNVAVEDGDAASLLSWYRTLIQARGNSPALRRGTYTPVAGSATSVLAFLRQAEGQTVLCLANLSDAPRSGLQLSVPGLAAGAYAATDLIDPTDAPVLTVAEGMIAGMDLAGHEVRAYELTTVTAVDPGPDGPPRTGLLLQQNHPNPFNPATVVRYELPRDGRVRIRVYDLAGREVAELADEVQTAGARQVRWDGLDDAGRAVGAGVYVLRLETEQETRQAKMTLVR